MAIRNDLSVDFYDSPRVVTIAQPSTTIVLQDLHDTLTRLQDSIEGSEFPDLIDSTGKGGGVTGIVSILQNAQIMFAPRTTKIETGTVTTPDVTGKTLIDSTALFQTNNVTRGDMSVNVTDGSHATVLRVVSETELVTLQLAGGIDNQWASADTYEIFDYELCSITGGDLFAVDDLGADISPILNSFGVFGPIVEQSTSPAAVPVQPDTLLEGSLSWGQAMKLILASQAGDVTGGGTTTINIAAHDGSKTRIIATVDVDGNRNVTFTDGA